MARPKLPPHCKHCKATDVPLMKAGNSKICRPCNATYCRRYRQTPQGKEAIRRAVKAYQERNPERVKAWRARHVVPKQPCEVCGNPKVDRHHDRPEFTYDVIFLCRTHHLFRHRLMTEGMGVLMEAGS